MLKNIVLSTILCTLGIAAFTQTRNIPAPAQEGAILLLGATAHLGTGEVIDNAAIGFDNGKLTLVADASTIRIDRSAYSQVVNLQGRHIYPGFILPDTDLGLVEVGSISDTEDASEQGGFNPSVRAIVAYNTDSEIITTMRFNGILMAQTTPRGGTVAGNSSVVQLDAWNWEDAAYKTDDGIHLYWPTKMFGPRWWMGETNPRKNPRYDEIMQELQHAFNDAASYSNLQARAEANLNLEAMLGLFNGDKTLFIHTDKAKAMVEAVKLSKKHGVQKVVIIGGAESMLVADFLKEHKVPVVLTNIHSMPEQDHEDTVYPFKLPAMMHEAGLDFSIGCSADMTARARNLPFLVGTAIAYGLPYEEGVKAVTANTARILGIEDRCGTLETGKDATLFVSVGDAFDMRTNQLEHAFIQGRAIQLDGRQQFLYEKYSKKYGHETGGNR